MPARIGETGNWEGGVEKAVVDDARWDGEEQGEEGLDQEFLMALPESKYVSFVTVTCLLV